MDNESIIVEYRFDKTPTVSTSASISTDGTAGFLSSYEINDFVAKLMHYKTLTVRGYNYKGTPKVFQVSLANSENSIRKLKAFSDIKSLNQIKTEQKALEAKLSQEEIESLKAALETVKVVAGENSEAYKAVKSQYEAAQKKSNMSLKRDK
jgi:hypothetical protein